MELARCFFLNNGLIYFYPVYLAEITIFSHASSAEFDKF